MPFGLLCTPTQTIQQYEKEVLKIEILEEARKDKMKKQNVSLMLKDAGQVSIKKDSKHAVKDNEASKSEGRSDRLVHFKSDTWESWAL